MTFLEKIQVIERVDGLIRRKATGTADELASRLGVSRSTVFEILSCMKSMGAEISYNDTKQSYYYTLEKDLAIGFVTKNEIYGGKNCIFFSQSDFFGLGHDTFTPSSDLKLQI